MQQRTTTDEDGLQEVEDTAPLPPPRAPGFGRRGILSFVISLLDFNKIQAIEVHLTRIVVTKRRYCCQTLLLLCPIKLAAMTDGKGLHLCRLTRGHWSRVGTAHLKRALRVGELSFSLYGAPLNSTGLKHAVEPSLLAKDTCRPFLDR